MALGNTYKVISIAKSRKVAEGIARAAEDNGLERVRIKEVEGARLWEIWAFITRGYKYIGN